MVRAADVLRDPHVLRAMSPDQWAITFVATSVIVAAVLAGWPFWRL